VENDLSAEATLTYRQARNNEKQFSNSRIYNFTTRLSTSDNISMNFTILNKNNFKKYYL